MADLLPALDVLAAVCSTFLLAGVIKGIVGFGLPTVALALLAATMGLKAAVALTVFPAFFTNIWQAAVGGQFSALLRRLAPFLLAAILGVGIGTLGLKHAPGPLLSVMLGVLIAIYAGVSLANWRLPPVGSAERWANPSVGLTNGVVTGMTGTFIVPGILYLQALRLPRTALIQAMGIVFVTLTAALGLFVAGNGLMPVDLASASLLATPCAFAGMVVGQRVRNVLSDAAFDRAFFAGLLGVGAFLIARNAGSLT
ncbi:MAG: sulfite exporter TauE/SafE family protein [Pseudomonadota bacterium]